MHDMASETAVVTLLGLQVIIAPDGDQWVAQALEIDYAAAGDSKEDVKQRFQNGLTATIGEHFKRFGGIDELLTPPPPSYWRDLLKTGQMELFSSVSTHEFEMPPGFPFGQINYYHSLERVG